MSLRARLVPAQGEPAIGAERIAVHHADGRLEEVVLHDYARLYGLPGVYEQIVQEDLGCRSPAHLAQLLGAAVDDLGRDRSRTRVIDVAAGNGVSGEALRAAGLHPVLGTDIVPEARAAARRDRPQVYDEYLTLDLLALSDAEAEHLRGLRADALCCVAPVGTGGVPPAAIAATAALLGDDALLVAMYDPRHGVADPLTEAFWSAHGVDGERRHHERYLHRFLITGAPYEMEANVWRLRRRASGAA
jgi:hypothetical protein